MNGNCLFSIGIKLSCHNINLHKTQCKYSVNHIYHESTTDNLVELQVIDHPEATPKNVDQLHALCDRPYAM